ncbi:CPCC family cysteine-rich protein [Listeria booriae]
MLSIFSDANNGLTLKEVRQNFKGFGTCELSMKPHVRKPKSNER